MVLDLLHAFVYKNYFHKNSYKIELSGTDPEN